MINDKFTFLGSSLLSVGVLESMYTKHIVPSIVITLSDKPANRNLIMQENIVTKWVKEKNIQRERNLEEEIILIKVDSLKIEFEKIKILIEEENIKFALTASFGKILSNDFINLFKYGILNIHPSGLPLYRGPSPIESQILDGLESIPVCIMQMDEKMDEGNIWYSEIANIDIKKENLNIDTLEYEIGLFGGEIFAKVINKILNGEIESTIQESEKVTYTRKFIKMDGDVTELMNNIKNLNKKINNQNSNQDAIQENSSENNVEENNKIINLEIDNLIDTLYRKYIAFTPWPGIYFTHIYEDKLKKEKSIKVKINEIKFNLETNKFEIIKLTPDSRKTISLKDFENSYGAIC